MTTPATTDFVKPLYSPPSLEVLGAWQVLTLAISEPCVGIGCPRSIFDPVSFLTSDPENSIGGAR